MARPTRPLTLACTAALAATVGLGTPPAHAVEGPSFQLTWDTHDRVYHEYGIGSLRWSDTFTLTNDGTETLHLPPMPDRRIDVSPCAALAPGASCTVIESRPSRDADYPGPVRETATFVMTTPDGTEVSRSLSKDIPVVDDMPQADSTFTARGTALIVCREFNHTGNIYSPEPVKLVSLLSARYGELLDPANTAVTRPQISGCAQAWQLQGEPWPVWDRVEAVLADDEGNQVTQGIFLGPGGIDDPHAHLEMRLPPTAPETGGRVPATVTVHNAGWAALTVGALRTPDGRELLAEAARPGSGVACAGTPKIAPARELSCSFEAVIEPGAPGQSATYAVQVDAVSAAWGRTLHASAGPSRIDYTDVAPRPTLTLASASLRGTTATLTVRLANATSEPVKLASLALGGQGTLLDCSCTRKDGITDAAPAECTLHARITSKPRNKATLKVTASVGDDEGNQATSALTTTVTRH